MGDRSHRRHRVFLEDARRDGSYLRATWHPERRLFTISTWNGEVCTGAVRIPATAAGELASLVVDGLAELATPSDAVVAPAAGAAGPVDAPAGRAPYRPVPARGQGARADWQAGMRAAVDRVRRWVHTVTAGEVPAPAVLLREPHDPASAEPAPAPAPAEGEQSA